VASDRAHAAESGREWTTRYPDLAGKTAIVAGESTEILDTVRALASNGIRLAIVAADRAVVDAARELAEALGADVLAITADPASTAVWARVTSHIEQRLGPIDLAIAIASAETCRVVVAAISPDMAARGRGVLIEAGPRAAPLPTATGVRHRAVRVGAGSPGDLAAAVLLCASDTVSATPLMLVVAQPPA
jgi:hypothetical protein